MERRGKSRAAVVLAVAAATSAAWISQGTHESLAAKKQAAGNLYVLGAQSGELDRVGTRGRSFRLVLRDPDGDVTSFTDRPARRAGHLKLASFIRRWRRLGFAEVPPNAALVIADAPSSRDVLVVELIKPKLRQDGVSFRTKLLKGSATGALRRFHQRADRRVGASFGELSLFIDPSGTQNGLQFKLEDVADPGFLLQLANASVDGPGGAVVTSGPTDLTTDRRGFRIGPKYTSAGPGAPIDAEVSLFTNVGAGDDVIRARTELPSGASGTVTVTFIDRQGFNDQYTLPVQQGIAEEARWPTDRIPIGPP